MVDRTRNDHGSAARRRGGIWPLLTQASHHRHLEDMEEDQPAAPAVADSPVTRGPRSSQVFTTTPSTHSTPGEGGGTHGHGGASGRYHSAGGPPGGLRTPGWTFAGPAAVGGPPAATPSGSATAVGQPGGPPGGSGTSGWTFAGVATTSGPPATAGGRPRRTGTVPATGWTFPSTGTGGTSGPPGIAHVPGSGGGRAAGAGGGGSTPTATGGIAGAAKLASWAVTDQDGRELLCASRSEGLARMTDLQGMIRVMDGERFQALRTLYRLGVRCSHWPGPSR